MAYSNGGYMRQAVRALIIKDDKTLLMHRNKFGHEYYTLIGGGIQPGETAEQALVREVFEETGFTVTNPRLVFMQDVPEPYGPQYVYYCETDGVEPVVTKDSEEAKINELGQNIHTPMWFPVSDLGSVPFRTPELQQAMILCIEHGFPARPVKLDRDYLEKVQTSIRKGTEGR